MPKSILLDCKPGCEEEFRFMIGRERMLNILINIEGE